MDKTNNLYRLDRCICGKLFEAHYIDYGHDLDTTARWHLFKAGMSDPLCEENRYNKKYTQMTPLELSVWIEENYERDTRNRALS